MSYQKQNVFTLRKLLCFLCILSLTVMLLGILPVHGEEKIYDDVLRLHVIANSDSDEDQALKLKVRDAVLGEVAELLRDCDGFDSALAVIGSSESIDILTKAALRVIREEGYGYGVTVTVGRERYPRKSYESLSFPSGTYTSLRVEIGESEGQNWWCVLFPRLCLDAASKTTDNEESFIEAGFTPEQYRIVTDTDEPKYEVKFKIMEIMEVIEGIFGG